MISKQAVEEQLKRIGFNFRLWGRAEVNELGRILFDDEKIAECVNGEYANGFALLVATNHRVLLVDKKPMLYLTVEDLRFDMITEFNFSHRLMNATVNFYTPNKTLIFTSWNQGRLRRLLEYTQQRVLEMRQQNHMGQQFQAAAAAQYAQLHAANHYQPQITPSYETALPTGQPVQQQPMPSASGSQYDQYNGGGTTPTHMSGAGTGQGQANASDQANLTSAMSVAYEEPQPQADTSLSRLAAKRATLGTYTRSKLPSFRRHHDRVENNMPDAVDPAQQPQSGEVYPEGYTRGLPVTDFGLPYKY